MENLYIVYAGAGGDGDSGERFVKEVIGPVSSNAAFQQYEMRSRGIYGSLAGFRKLPVSGLVAAAMEHDIGCVVADGCIHIITIDPDGAKDLDDGFSISTVGGDGLATTTVTTYISLVAEWVDMLDCWGLLCDPENLRVSTIYLSGAGGENRPIFPAALSNSVMSLLADGRARPVLASRFVYRDGGGGVWDIVDQSVEKLWVKIKHNYTYESPEMMADPDYNELLRFTREIAGGVRGAGTVADSHDLVEYWMKRTCSMNGALMAERGIKGIYRWQSGLVGGTDSLKGSVLKPQGVCSGVGCDGPPLFDLWKTTKTEYVLGEGGGRDNVGHSGLGMVNYAHITSPIRRWVDIWNQKMLLEYIDGGDSVGDDNVGGDYCGNGDDPDICGGVSFNLMKRFIFEQNGLPIINHKMKQIKKTQQLCNLLYAVGCGGSLGGTDAKGVVFGGGGIKASGWPFYDHEKSVWRIYIPQYSLWSKLYIEHQKIAPHPDPNNQPLLRNSPDSDGLVPLGPVECHIILYQYEYNIKRKIRVIYNG